MSRPDIFLVSAEPSGDQLAASLAKELTAQKPDIQLAAIGGSALAEAGLESRMDVSGLAILGFVEALKSYGLVLRKVREATQLILDANPSIVVLIDSWGFMVRVAKALKGQDFEGKIVKYVAPQVWAMRSGRARILARHIDHLLSTQPMDEPYFEAAGLPQTFVGNPALDRDYRSGDGKLFKRLHNLEGDRPVIGVFFGSRPSEIERVGPAILKTLDSLCGSQPDVQPVFVIAESVRDSVEQLIGGRQGARVGSEQLVDAMASMDAAIACSGTITTQLAAAGVPSVVLYRLSTLTYAVASRIFKPRHISLVNISADRDKSAPPEPLMPEFMQADAMSDQPAEALIGILSDDARRRQLSQALIDETRRMGAGSGSASQRAAEVLIAML